MKFHIYAEVSTAHITLSDAEILDSAFFTNAVPDIVVHKYEYGYLIPLMDEMGLDAAQNAGLSCAFIELIDKCRKAGAQMLILDADVLVDNDLPVFDW